MRIGLLSDTHKKIGRAKRAIEFLVNQKIEYLIHAGDMGKLEVLEALKETGLPYICVIGNNDHHLIEYADEFNLVREPHYFKIEDLKFKLMHHPFYLTPDVDVVIYGHTHFSEFDFKNKTLFLNPGEVCARDTNRSECMILEVVEDRYKLEYYHRTIKNREWEVKRVEYKRD